MPLAAPRGGKVPRVEGRSARRLTMLTCATRALPIGGELFQVGQVERGEDARLLILRAGCEPTSLGHSVGRARPFMDVAACSAAT